MLFWGFGCFASLPGRDWLMRIPGRLWRVKWGPGGRAPWWVQGEALVGPGQSPGGSRAKPWWVQGKALMVLSSFLLFFSSFFAFPPPYPRARFACLSRNAPAGGGHGLTIFALSSKNRQADCRFLKAGVSSIEACFPVSAPPRVSRCLRNALSGKRNIRKRENTRKRRDDSGAFKNLQSALYRGYRVACMTRPSGKKNGRALRGRRAIPAPLKTCNPPDDFCWETQKKCRAMAAPCGRISRKARETRPWVGGRKSKKTSGLRPEPDRGSALD